MIPVSDAATVRARDAAIINTLGIPGHTLMELAGRGAADRIHATPQLGFRASGGHADTGQ